MSKMTSKSKFATNWICLLLAGTLVCSGTLLAQTAEKPKRNLLFIGQAKGYQHEAISTAMATLYNLGRSSGLWNTQLRTDCTAITKKPLKWEAKNMDAFDAIVFFTDGDLDMDASQKADLLSFVRDDGKGFIGIHSARDHVHQLARVRADARRLFRRSPVGPVQRAARRGRFKVPRNEAFFDGVYALRRGLSD